MKPDVDMVCVKAFIPSYWNFNMLHMTIDVGDRLLYYVPNKDGAKYYIERDGQLMGLSLTEEELTNFVSERHYKVKRLLGV